MLIPPRIFLGLLLMAAIFLVNCSTLRKTTAADLGAEEVSTFILVRHAEKEYGEFPGLTEEGLERARRLAYTLENTELDAVYSSKTKRTEMTAAPTATAKSLNIIAYDPGQLQDFAKDLKRLYRGKTVLVVGHSNTTPALANYLADTDEFPRFSELDYTNLYIVTLPRIGAPRVVKLRF